MSGEKMSGEKIVREDGKPAVGGPWPLAGPLVGRGADSPDTSGDRDHFIIQVHVIPRENRRRVLRRNVGDGAQI
jgi:hypothetical protein